jgi:hypothetical protein
MKQKEFIKILKSEGISFEEKNGKIIINGGYVYLSSLTTLPEGIQFNNGGYVDLKNGRKKIGTPFLKRYGIKENDGFVILYKRVSKDFKTQEGTKNETLWNVGTTVTHPSWKPEKEECGSGKFHACPYPHWCDSFRSNKGDKYIAIKVNVSDLYEWTNNPSYPNKIAFRSCTVLKQVNRK